ncbi:MAG: beta-N-acetylhexosaminidase [Proteobacteria bacterium]|nr:beta-N-acetylhexosaminidase [Pseudomonadota bacterium]MBU4297851.1 beta-N-acetylhexosaminidase [Pseudomonadota bacterium]MCG2746217.1 beta-N-acetylhexosaminidase [Desulfobulbaceae bacterium]
MSKFAQLGQLFMVGIPGKDLDDSTLRLIGERGINNFIIFKRNVDNPEQLSQLCTDVKAACQQVKLPPPLIAIDQEGGTVARLPVPFTQFANARQLAGSADPVAALADYANTCARELVQAGINMNLAPVLDVCPAGQGFFMEKRSLGADPQLVGQLGSRVIKGLQGGGVAACGKHFPGLGAAKLDPHLQLPVVARALSEIREFDLVPFQKAIAADVAAIMTSHTIYEHLDAATPATLSKHILTDLLRSELGFDGLIITDDLEMGAIENERTVSSAAVQAFTAGADMILICHEHEKVCQAYGSLMEEISAGRVTLPRCAKSLARVDAVRQRFA